MSLLVSDKINVAELASNKTKYCKHLQSSFVEVVVNKVVGYVVGVQKEVSGVRFFLSSGHVRTIKCWPLGGRRQSSLQTGGRRFATVNLLP